MTPIRPHPSAALVAARLATRLAARLATVATVLAAGAASAQGIRPVPTGPVNVIRLSDPTQDPTADTSHTVFFLGGRPPRDPATDPRPGDELVTWRSTWLVHGVAGSDPGYIQATAAADRALHATRAAQAGHAGGGGGVIGTIVFPGVFGGWGSVPVNGVDRPAPRRLSDQFPRPWIGGESGIIPSPILQPEVPSRAAPTPIRARPKP